MIPKEERQEDGAGMFMRPPHPDACQECAAVHHHSLPHNKYSLYYAMKFFNDYGREPTWGDAMAHCSDEVKEAVRELIRNKYDTTDQQEKSS